MSWFLYRDDASRPTQDLQAFTGPNTSGGTTFETDLPTAIPGFDFSLSHTFRIELTTAADGESYFTQIFVDNISLTSFTTSRSITEVQSVGLSYDNTGTSSPLFQNFVLTATAVPEPSTVALLGFSFASAFLIVRRRKA